MKNFKKSIIFLLSYTSFWIGYFVFARIFFLLYYLEKTKEIGWAESLKTFFYGFQLDLSFASYLSAIPFLLVTFSKIIASKKMIFSINFFTYFCIIFISLLLFIDAGLYQAWGIRLDTSLLPYLNTPELMISSASKTQLIWGIIGWIMVSVSFSVLYKLIIIPNPAFVIYKSWKEFPVFLMIFGTLVIPIRGGFQLIPVNQSNVYFSENMFANHASLNYTWNFFNTITHKTDGNNPYVAFPTVIANTIIENSRKPLLTVPKTDILTTPKPNIVLILWESLSAKVVGSLGGELDV
ncbi:MAG: LTA synthase family protein, partial [Polaribacter sp.]|nr:LTA synthase family protein [Polaribacter sp.]